MNPFETEVSWVAVGVATVLCFVLGYLWYSPMMFGKSWAEGVGADIGPDAKAPVGAMVTQLIGVFLLAWLVAISVEVEAWAATAMMVLMAALLVMSANMFAQHSDRSTLIQGAFVIVMGALMTLCAVYL